MLLRFLRAGLPACVVPLVLIAACSDDDGSGPTAEIRKFCQDLFASPAYACCSPAEKGDAVRYASPDDCANRIAVQLSSSEGRQAFDGAAATSCLSHLGSRKCGVSPSAHVKVEEEKAGCSRVTAGKQDEGKPCQVHEDCKPGLVCPPLKETGLS